MRNKLVGNIGEKIAADHLKDIGYKILERNAVYLGAEADIIAKDKDVIVFCEVKTRSDAAYGIPAEAVTPYKQRQYIKLAQAYMLRHRVPDAEVRFDVIEVTEEGVNHIISAF